MQKLLETVRGIDWTLLRLQKEWLADVAMRHPDPDYREGGEGILSLLDAIMDAVVEDGVASERDVFGKTG